MKSQPSRNSIVFVQPRRRAPQEGECGSNQVLLGREQNMSQENPNAKSSRSDMRLLW
jgi:hypothetical protein